MRSDRTIYVSSECPAAEGVRAVAVRRLMSIYVIRRPPGIAPDCAKKFSFRLRLRLLSFMMVKLGNAVAAMPLMPTPLSARVCVADIYVT
jgi:hypothetical protein